MLFLGHHALAPDTSELGGNGTMRVGDAFLWILVVAGGGAGRADDVRRAERFATFAVVGFRAARVRSQVRFGDFL